MKLKIIATTVLMLITVTVSPLASQTKEQRDAANKVLASGGTLHDAAKVAGGRYSTSAASEDGWVDYSDLKALSRESNEILVGTPTGNVCKLTSDGKNVRTIYEVRVDDTVKGKFKNGDVVLVSLPGGRVSFEDGSIVQVNSPTFMKMINGSRYVLYLHPSEAHGSLLIPTGGSQGIFELKPDGTVQPHARSESVSKNKGRKESEFLDDVRRSKD